MKIGDVVKGKEHYHLQLGQNPVGLVLNSSANERNGLPVYEVQLFGAYIDGEIHQRIDQFKFYRKDLEVISECR